MLEGDPRGMQAAGGRPGLVPAGPPSVSRAGREEQGDVTTARVGEVVALQSTKSRKIKIETSYIFNS